NDLPDGCGSEGRPCPHHAPSIGPPGWRRPCPATWVPPYRNSDNSSETGSIFGHFFCNLSQVISVGEQITMNFKEICAVVTGAASGLGRAVAQKVVAEGGRVTLLDVQDEAGRTAAQALGSDASFVHCDVTNEAQVNSAIETAKANMGGLNLAVNCAGVV